VPNPFPGKPIAVRNLFTHTEGMDDGGIGYLSITDPNSKETLAEGLAAHIPARVNEPTTGDWRRRHPLFAELPRRRPQAPHPIHDRDARPASRTCNQQSNLKYKETNEHNPTNQPTKSQLASGWPIRRVDLCLLLGAGSDPEAGGRVRQVQHGELLTA
jgi:hypothetical protein